MMIPVLCQSRGKLIATYDTANDVSPAPLEAPCGEKVCEACCEACERENTDGMEAERICKERGLDYYIKDALRAEMEKVTP